MIAMAKRKRSSKTYGAGDGIDRGACAKGSIRKLKNGAVVCCPKGAWKSGRCPIGMAAVNKGAKR